MTEPAVLQALVDASVRALLIAAAVGIALEALRIRQSSVRHAAWTAVVLAMLALPVAPKWLPAVPVAMPQAPALTSAEAPTFAQPATSPRGSTPSSAPAVSRAQPAPQSERAFPAESVAQQSALSTTSRLLAIWIGGVALMLARFAIGWRRAARLAARAGRQGDVCQTPLVSTPLAVGVFAPRILVPSTWSSWPDDLRTSVLLHEQAHIRRRDTLVGAIAHLNRCIFWFHPLAWWLERRIAATAEQACDDEVMRANASAHQYATALVEMADAVRQQGSRVLWSSAAVVGRGPLTARIERILDGRAGARDSATKQWSIALLTLSLIVPGIACQQAPPPLKENPELKAQFEREAERNARYEAAKSLTLEQANALEAKVLQNPDDVELTSELLYFYLSSGTKVMGWNEMVAARRPHLLRLIAQHPDSNAVRWPIPRRLDPEGWNQARAIWMKHVSAPNVPSKVLANAAAFFAVSEKAVAEELLFRGKKTDPDGPQPRVEGNIYYSPWSERLGSLYARAIVGSDDDTLGNVVRSVSLAEAESPFAAHARRTLEESTDPALLRAAGQYLASNARGRGDGRVGDQGILLGFDHRALGNSYLDRAAALDPDSATTRRFEMYRKRATEHDARYQLLKTFGGYDDVTVAQVEALPDADQFQLLPEVGGFAIMAAENVEHSTGDITRFNTLLARAREFGDAALKFAGAHKGDPRAARTEFDAHMVLGVVDLRQNKRASAVAHLTAGGALASPDIAAIIDEIGMRYRLTNYLLSAGERETVAAFFDKVAAFPSPSQKRLATDAQAVRNGMMPEAYQRQMR